MTKNIPIGSPTTLGKILKLKKTNFGWTIDIQFKPKIHPCGPNAAELC